MENFELLIWDFDGTICNTRKAIISTLSSTLESIDIPHSVQQIEELIGQGLRLEETLEAITPNREESFYSDCIKSYRQAYGEKSAEYETLFEGVTAVFEKLGALQKKVIVISNKGEKALNDALERFALAKYAQQIIGARKDIPAKPDPALYEKVIAQTFPQINRKKILMIGDTHADLEFAKNVDIASCWAKYGYGDKGACEALAPDYIIESPLELLSI